MFTAKALKAYVAAFIAGVAAMTIAAETPGFTLIEIFTILGAILAAFQATYWTTNAKTYDGSIDVVKQPDGKKTFMLNLDGDPANLDAKSDIVFKVNPS